jgi:hypothetical protein
MSEIKVNKLSPRTNCGTVQLGDSGDTITIPAGATITNNGTAAGFGATGAASWDTTVKTSGFTAVSGVGYFVNTTAGAISVNLPAGTAGDVVAIKDYANTFDSNAVTLVQNGSDKIGGSTVNATLSVEGQAVTLVFIDSTQGWLVTDSGLQSNVDNNPFLVATGGTITEDGDFKVHTFTGPGTFNVTCLATSPSNNVVAYMVVAGGGGSGACKGGGAGAGGFREGTTSPIIPYTASPLVAPAGLPVSVQPYPITVGAGGAGAFVCGTQTSGANSIFSTITSAGGGRGSDGSPGSIPSANGGSGGGGSRYLNTPGNGNTPPVSPPQGNNGGSAGFPGAPGDEGAGGGGATAVGQNSTDPAGGDGGAGATTLISGSPTAYAGGGGGGTACGGNIGTGGTGGGGPGGGGSGNPGVSGTTNTGGGGGGGPNFGSTGAGGSGGSGIVIIRYKFQ